jgi:NTE family protein
MVGTSAGSVVASLYATDPDVESPYEAQLADHTHELRTRFGARTLLAYGWAMLSSREPERYRARLGALAAAELTTYEERRALLAARLPVRCWPDKPLLITAVDASTGQFVVFDRDSGVEIIDAVAASCAIPGVWTPAVIDGRRYIDGAVRSATNADLARGHGRVVILAPVTLGGGPMASTARQAAELRAGGAQVAVVSPDRAARAAIGLNMLDPAHRAAAARAGRAQAEGVAAAIHDVWAN